MITRARASALLFGGAALTQIGLPARAAPKPVRGLNKIDHIIVIYLENRSFDHLYGLVPGVEGLAQGRNAAPQVDANGTPYSVLPAFAKRPLDPSRSTFELPPLPNQPFDLTQFVAMDQPLNSSFEQANTHYFAQQAINGGKMDRYVAISGSPVMGYYDGRKLPMWEYARDYVLADHFFQGAFGGTAINHCLLFSGAVPRWPNAPAELVAQVGPDGTLLKDGFVTPDGFIVNNLSDAVFERVPLQTMPHIGNRLDGASISWAWYSGPQTTHNMRPYLLFADVTTGTPGAQAHVKGEDAFLSDLKNGSLPQVSFVKPSDSEHPKDMIGLLADDQHTADLVKAVQDSPYWKSSVIVVTYDEGHSYWDHVVPPIVDRWGPGRRVPAIIISPFAKRHFIDHTRYDTTSILKLIETRFGLDPLGPRDAAVADLTAALNLA
jgi:phospholipase C